MRNDRRSLGWKFSLVLLITLALFGISAFLVGHGMELVRRSIGEKDAAQNRVTALWELNAIYRDIAIEAQDYISSRDERRAARLDELFSRARGIAEDLLRADADAERRERLEALLEKENAFRALLSARPVSAGDAAELRGEIFALAGQLLEAEQAGAGAWENRTYSQLRGNTLALVFSVAVSAVVGLIMVLMVSLRVRRSLHEVVGMADGIAQKNLLVPDMDYLEEDEIGRLAAAMNRMKGNLLQIMEGITRASRLVAGESRKLMEFTVQVGSGGREISATAEDLSQRSGDQAAVSRDLAGRMDHFAGQISSVVQEKDRLGELSVRMLELTDEGASSMESSTAVMDEIDGSIDRSLAVVRGLNEKTEQIADIVGVVREIADQTELLALNAAIEAARAGEHGQSFAVVADNIRKLAERVQSSLAHIARAAAEIRDESENAVRSLDRGYRIIADGKELVRRTSDTFMRLKAEIEQIGRQIGSMSASLDDVRDQTLRIHHFLGDTVNLSERTAAGAAEMSAISGRFGLAVQEVERSAADLDRAAGELNGLIGQFRLQGGDA